MNNGFWCRAVNAIDNIKNQTLKPVSDISKVTTGQILLSPNYRNIVIAQFA